MTAATTTAPTLEAIRPVRTAAGERSHTDEMRAYARLMWSTLANPGDEVAGVLIRALGPEIVFTVLNSPAGELARLVAIGTPDIILTTTAIEHAQSRWLQRAAGAEARLTTDCMTAASLGAQFITPEDTLWPNQLNDLNELAPYGLWVRGKLDLLGTLERSVTVTGTRASTAYGNQVTHDLVCAAVDDGIAVVTGAAYGIEAAATRSAIAREGSSVAVLAGGIDRAFPSGHRDLFEQLFLDGLVISEFPIGTTPARWRFIRRSQILAALSAATVIVEAGQRSSSLTAALTEAALSRPTGAVPGPVTSSSSVGCHALIRDGKARLVASGEDLIQLVGDAGNRA